MKHLARGFTLFELLVVITLVGLSVFPLLFSAKQAGQLESLRTSTLVFSNALQEAHNSARDSRNQSAWGVIYLSENEYQLVYGSNENNTVSRVVTLENGATFKDPFVSIWFAKGSGNTPPQTIKLKNELGRVFEVNVNELGIVETKEEQKP